MPSNKQLVTSNSALLRPGKGVTELEAALRRLALKKSWDAKTPLPTTRELGDRYGVSNASACRLLKKLDAEKVLWRRANGRYYPLESRHMFERRKPYACLLRKLRHWSRIYQGIMSGFSQAFGRNRAAMLFVHNESLVRHADTEHPPLHAGATAQHEAIAEFFRDYEDQFGGILLDDVWLDDVLEEFSAQLTNAVIVCRKTRLPGLASVSIDFESSAVLAVGHLFARGYEEIWIAVPFSGAAPVDLMRAAALRAASMLGRPIEESNVCQVSTPAERAEFVRRLQATSRRVGIFCLEDNIAAILRGNIADANIACPGRAGIISAMGTNIVTDRNITTLVIDYERIGLEAGKILADGSHRAITLPTMLALGQTT